MATITCTGCPSVSISVFSTVATASGLNGLELRFKKQSNIVSVGLGI